MGLRGMYYVIRRHVARNSKWRDAVVDRGRCTSISKGKDVQS